MSRTVIVGLLGAAILVLAIVLNLWSNKSAVQEAAEPLTTEATSTDGNNAGSGAPPAAEGEEESAELAALPPPETTPDTAVEENIGPVRPTFDVVRIDPSGDAVIAGRAEPSSSVTIQDFGEDIGVVEADGRGEWVFLPTTPLTPGPHELRLRSELTDGTILMGEGTVVLIVPEPGQDIAGREADPDGSTQQPVVVLIPDDGQVGAELIQAPTAGQAPAPVPEDAAPVEALGDNALAALPSTATAEPSGVASDDGSMSVETIDYDSAGNISIAGTAPRESTVIAYLDGGAIGSGSVDTNRKWRITPDQEVAPGVYTLRLDAVDNDTVISRLEIPFSRAAPLADLDGDAFIVVQPGNSLWRIARRTLGDGVSFTVIYEANEDQIRDPDLIYPGQVFEIPR